MNFARLLPQSLFVRLLLIWLAGMAIVLGISLWLFQVERERIGLSSRLDNLVQEVASTLETLDALPAQNRADWLHATHLRRYHLHLGNLPPQQPDAHLAPPAPLIERLREALQPRPLRPLGSVRQERHASHFLYTELRDGQPVTLEMYTPTRRPPPPAPLSQWLLPLGALLAGATLLFWLALRLTIQPLARFIHATRLLGDDPEHAPPPSLSRLAPKEVQQASAAFAHLQERIRAHLDERTRILGAISHDLQTPVTRMRLRAELIDDDELRERLQADLSDMQTLIEEGLAYARSLNLAHRRDAARAIDLDALLAVLCDDASDMGWQVTPPPTPSHATVFGHEDLLRRALWNLVSNGIKFGQRVHLTVSADAQQVIIEVRDEGTGLPEAQLEKVFEPFYRLEGSRNRDTGGTGLGLAITRNLLATQHGTVTLANAPAGGLAARITLPRHTPAAEQTAR